MIITKNELLSASGINNNQLFCLTMDDGHVEKGKLCAVSKEHIILETNNQEKVFDWDRIVILELEKKAATKRSNYMNNASLRSWNEYMLEKSNMAFSVRYSLTTCYDDLFDKIADMAYDIRLSQLFRVKNSRKMYDVIDDAYKDRYFNILDSVINKIYLNDADPRMATAKSVARGLVCLAAKDYACGVRELIELMQNYRDLLPLVCFYHDLGDECGCFYWLSIYYDYVLQNASEFKNSFDQENGLWWNYLSQAVSLNYYDRLIPQLLDLFDIDASQAIRSLSFVFYKANEYNKSITLFYDQNKIGLVLLKDWYEKFFYSLGEGNLYNEHYSRYARYLKCLETIIDNQLYHSYASANDIISGIVYEYVPSRGYCRVLGYDLLSYFLHFDDDSKPNGNSSFNIKKALNREICSLEPVENEFPVSVKFQRNENKYAKKSYDVFNAELTAFDGSGQS